MALKLRLRHESFAFVLALESLARFQLVRVSEQIIPPPRSGRCRQLNVLLELRELTDEERPAAAEYCTHGPLWRPRALKRAHPRSQPAALFWPQNSP